MGDAERLHAVTDDPSFERLKRVHHRGGRTTWEIWISDGRGVLHVLEGATKLACVEQAERLIARRGA